MLSDIVGDFISAKDIPRKAIIRNTTKGDIAISVINKLYDHCYAELTGHPMQQLGLDIARVDIGSAIDGFKLFNILEDADALIETIKYIYPGSITISQDVKNYINAAVNKFFKYVRPQIDCKMIVDGTLGELHVIASSLNIPVNTISHTTLRETKKKSIVIPNELTMMASLKIKLEEIYTLFYEILRTLHKLGAKELAPNEECEIDL